MKRKIFLLFLFFLRISTGFASIQIDKVYSNLIDSESVYILTIEEAQDKAESNYPAIAEYNIIESSKEFSISNANKAYLPQGTLSAQGTWQSDVVEIPIDMPGLEIPSIDQDQYRVVAELNQLIWDGGRVTAQKKSVEANAEIQKKQLDSEVYALKERVNNLFFGILLMKGRLNQQTILEKELQRNYDNVQVYVQNGLANNGDLNVVRVEQIKANQQRVQIESTLEAYIQMLSVLIGEQLSLNTEFVKPDNSDTIISPVINRPELAMFEAQERAVETQKSLLNAKLRPTIGAFAQGGYGKPGLNMFDSEFTPYFIGGVRISWNFGNLYTSKNDKKKLDLQKQSVNSKRETFLYNLNMVIPQQLIEINKLNKTMQYDEEIINLQTQIRKASELKVENGTMTVSELMKDINAEEVAKQAKLLHEIQHLMSLYSLKYTTN